MSDFYNRRAILKELLDNEELVNGTILTEDGGVFKVHLEILAAMSPYFRRIINATKDTHWESILIPGTPKDVVANIIHYMYTGELRLTLDKVNALSKTAELLGIPNIIKLCRKFLISNLNNDNCIVIYSFAKYSHYSDLKEEARAYILAHFQEIFPVSNDYLNLEMDDLIAILSSDSLNVNSEEYVFWAVMRWVEKDPGTRITHLPALLRCVRFGLCSPQAYHGMVWHEGYVYVIGGFDGNQCFNSVRRFDPVLHAWEEKGCMYAQRCYVSVAAVGKFIYAMGGYDGHRRNRSCERYDPCSNQWKMVASMLHVRSDASAAALKGKVYIAGGFNGQQVLNSAECYDPQTDEWTAITSMNSPRSGVKLVAYCDQIYIIGGFNGNSRLATVEKFDPRTKLWTSVSNMNGPRSNFATAVLFDCLYVIGGFNGLATISNVECYDHRTNIWNQVTELNLNRSALAACTVKGIPNAHEYTFLGNVPYP